MTFGQPRKLCLLGGVLPRAIEHRSSGSTFRGRFFRPCGIFEEGRNFAFWGNLRGACGLVRPHARALTSREFGPFLAFPLFRRIHCPVPTTRKTPRRHLLRLMASGAIRLPRMALSRGGDAQKCDRLRRSSWRQTPGFTLMTVSVATAGAGTAIVFAALGAVDIQSPSFASSGDAAVN